MSRLVNRVHCTYILSFFWVVGFWNFFIEYNPVVLLHSLWERHECLISMGQIVSQMFLYKKPFSIEA